MHLRIALFSSALLLGVATVAYAGPAQESDDKPKPKIVAPMPPTAAASRATASGRTLATADDKGDDKGGDKDKGGGKKIASSQMSARSLASADDKGEDKGGDKDKGGGKKIPAAAAFNPAALRTAQQTAASPQ